MHNPGQLLDAPYTRIVATPVGMSLLETDEQIRSVVTEFCYATENAEQVLAQPGYRFVGSGLNAQVRQIDNRDIVLKVSTPSTANTRSGAIENAIAQVLFMEYLREQLLRHTAETLSAPAQYFAIRTTTGNFIQAHQYMSRWESLADRTSAGHTSREALEQLFTATKTRIVQGLGKTSLLTMLGANDLGLERTASLNSRNILIPRDVQSLYEAPLCLIDQPKNSIRGALTGYLASVVLHSSGSQAPFVDIRR